MLLLTHWLLAVLKKHKVVPDLRAFALAAPSACNALLQAVGFQWNHIAQAHAPLWPLEGPSLLRYSAPSFITLSCLSV
jgi:uncharacterized protein YejL (UPF0352 family)